MIIESKLDVGVPSGKLSWPPKNCMPNRAKMKMKRKRRSRRDMMEDKAFIRAITRFRSGDQYLGQVKRTIIISTATATAQQEQQQHQQHSDSNSNRNSTATATATATATVPRASKTDD